MKILSSNSLSFCSKFFLLIFLSFFFSKSFASCVNIEVNEGIANINLLENGVDDCDRNSEQSIPIYHDPTTPGKDLSFLTRDNYTIRLAFNRDDNVDITNSGDQTLFAIYDTNNNPLAKALIKYDSVDQGIFVYELYDENGNAINTNGVKMSEIGDGDPFIVNPIISHITYNQTNKELVININNNKVPTLNIDPIVADEISRIEYGSNYSGSLSFSEIFIGVLEEAEMSESSELIADTMDGSVDLAESRVDENGVLISGEDPEKFASCSETGKVFDSATESCSYPILTFGQDGNDAAPENVDYGLTITYDPNIDINSKAAFSCITDYQPDGSNPAQYWFETSGETSIVRTEGECVSALNVADNNCYSADIGTVGSWGGCDGMLIVDLTMIQNALNNGNVVSHGGIDYNVGNSLHKIFTGQVTNMNSLFYNKTDFNEDISYWDVSNVTDMGFMFREADEFNRDISSWNVGNVTTMHGMFYDADAFNQDLSSWDVTNVTTMASMFQRAYAFNQDLSGWDVSNVTDMRFMFSEAGAFNGSVNWGSKVSNVTNMRNMFYGADAFNQDLSSWDVSSVTTMQDMFRASNFNSNLNWGNKVSNVTNMQSMFHEASNFNKDISGWDISSVTNMSYMLYKATSFNQNLSGWCVSMSLPNSNYFDNDVSGGNYAPPTFNC
jgi:surface protein